MKVGSPVWKTWQAMTKTTYTFGDSDEASSRLRNLANLYEADTRSLLKRSEVDRPRLAIDLGCGPGWSTSLIREILNPQQTIGLDASMRYLAEARENHGQLIEFKLHDVTQIPFPTRAPDLMFCRFLLTHLESPEKVLANWKQIAQPGAFLLIHETESMESENPSLIRYYELVGQLQEHYGQKLQVGGVLESCVKQAGWRVIYSSGPVLEKPAQLMAELHLANIRSWRRDKYASQSFDAGEMDLLESSLRRIASGKENARIVRNTARQIIAQA
jgi:trans-aconitate 2-methyltransferase